MWTEASCTAKGQESEYPRMKTDTAPHCVLAVYCEVKAGLGQEKVGTNRSKREVKACICICTM